MESKLKLFKSKNVILVDDLSDYSVLFQPLTAETIGLNETGLSIWNLIDGNRSVSEIADSIANEFSFNNTESLDDVSKFTDALYRKLFILKNREESDKFENFND